MAKAQGAIVVDIERCKGCSLCVVSCPTDVIAMTNKVNSKGYHYAHMVKQEACIGCSNCGLVCPDSCITVYQVKPAKKEAVEA